MGELRADKAPGPDGLGAQFYKEYSDELAPRLLAVYQESLETGLLPDTMREALIITLLKPDKDPLSCDSYRPLSLINTDVKILAKLLATRLQPLLPMVILPDQSGFVPGRSTAHNLRTILSLMHYLDPNLPALAALLDATKAFDSLEWGFLFPLLTRMGFGPFFIQQLKLLYTSITARVQVNGLISDSFQITRGTRQGCPLSPLLFSIATEPLAARIRQHHTNRAIGFTTRALSISLYADDIALYMVHPEENLSPMIREVMHYGALSGVNTKWRKSVLFPLTKSTRQFDPDYPLTWATGPVRYLGIWLSQDVNLLWSENYGRTVMWIEGKIKTWRTLPLSMAGRIALAKMIVLPKLLYLFVNLPIPLPKCFLARLRSLMIELVWAGHQPRIKGEILTLPLEQGGMAAPDLSLYAFCSQAHFLHYWVHPTPFQPHVALETDKVAPVPLATALYQPYRRPRAEIDTVQTLRWAWAGLCARSGVPILYAPAMPLKHHPLLPSLLGRGTWNLAASHGLTTWGDLFPNESFLSLQEMCTPAQPTTADALLYYQIRATCKDIFPTFPVQPPTMIALEHILTFTSPTKLITRLYKTMQHHYPVTAVMARTAWDSDLETDITDAKWALACRQTRQLTVNHTLRLLHFKFLHRLYRTPLQLHRMGLRDNARCWKCGHLEAGFLYLAWYCQPVASYWVEVLRHITDITSLTIPETPLTTLLGIIETYPPAKTRLTSVLLLLAKRQIALHWGAPHAPSIKEWVTSVTHCQIQLATYWELQPIKLRPRDIWEPYVTWLTTCTLDT